MSRAEGNAQREAIRGGGIVVPDLLDLMRRVPAMIYVSELGPQGRFEYISDQVRDVLGYTPGEWCQDESLWASRVHPEDRERVLGTEAAMAAGEPSLGPSEYRLIRRDGDVVWVHDEAVIVETPFGRRWHGVMTDITDRKLAEEELTRRAAQQTAVAMLGEHALEGAPPIELMRETVRALAEILEAEMAVVLEARPDQEMVVRIGHGWPEDVPQIRHFHGGERSYSGYAVLTGTPVIVDDWETERRFTFPEGLRQTGVRSGLAVPIEGGHGRFGALTVQSTRRREFSAGDVAFVQGMANVLADALARQAGEDAIRHTALHDALTGLPNRVLFLDRVEQALHRMSRRTGQAAVLFLDLDHFKLINDSLGHSLGDELLAAVAVRIQGALRSDDTVARFGGDEFGVLLEVGGEREAVAAADRICSVFAEPFALAGTEQYVTASIGIAVARGGETTGELIRDADAAMYRSKDHGRARHELFDEVMRSHAVVRLRVENNLRRALERDELSLVYQPVVDARDRRLVGVETLLRWEQPDGAPVATRDVISIAEENGLIEPIGRWVLEQACRQGAQWFRARTEHSPAWIAVNLSPVQISRPTFPAVVAEVLGRTGLEPSALYLEITETVMLRQDHALMEVIRGLKRLGVRLMLDDFGTGYSSLAYLSHLPIDALKIDRSFVDGLGTEARDTAITEAIIGMARALGLQVIGEGVETALQAAELARLGCDLAQGFHFGYPGPPEAIDALLAPRIYR